MATASASRVIPRYTCQGPKGCRLYNCDTHPHCCTYLYYTSCTNNYCCERQALCTISTAKWFVEWTIISHHLTCWYIMEMASVTSGGNSDSHPGTQVTRMSCVSPAARTRIVLLPIDLYIWCGSATHGRGMMARLISLGTDEDNTWPCELRTMLMLTSYRACT